MIRRTQVCSAVLVALGGTLGVASIPAFGQQTLERVEITGSSIRRIAGETALPVTVIKVEDLAKQGVTNTEAAIAFIASNQSNFGSSQAIGATTGGKAEADLRGLSGPTGTNANKTLVLLNGRRLANHAFDAAAVDLNAIPLAAIQRIEVLRDGASAIYGTDAIGGVINFITKRELTGLEVSAQLAVPEKSGGGDTKRVSLSGGFGTLSQNRFNLMASLDWRKQDVLPANRREFSKTGIIGTGRDAILSGTSGTSFPGDINGFEPTGPNCSPPASVPLPNAAGTGFSSCRYDFTQDIDILTQSEQITGLLRASFAVTPDHIASFEYLNSNNKSIARVAPAPTNSSIPATSPFYPAGAPVGTVTVPTFAGGNGQTTVPGGIANWRQVPAGKRTSGDDTTTERMMLGMEGLFGDWDYRTAVGSTKNESEANVKGGYVNDTMIRQGIWNGVINPFGAQTAAGSAAIAAAQVNAPTIIGTNKSDFVDLRVSNPSLFKLGAGSVGAAFGVEYRNEKLDYEALPITGQLGSLGIDPNSDTTGKRNNKSAFAEFSIPVVKDLELTLAGRYDDYSDTGSTFNPKVGLRYQPTKALLIRGSANTGFRAPTLFEIYQPQSLTFTSDNYNDPQLCPGGNAVGGAQPGRVCGQQVLQRQGGPVANGFAASSLQPEKSKAFTIGLVFEPSNNVTLGFDVWQLKIRNMISSIPEQAVFGAPAKYSAKFFRCSQIPATGAGITRANIDACAGYPNIGFDPIAFIDARTENLGELHTSGIDLSAAWRSGATPAGNFGVSMEGTYITKYQYQREQGGAFFDAVGRYSDNAPVFRWQHVLSGTWSKGPWAATLTNRFKGSYSDQNDAGKVGAYSIFDLSGSWTGVKNLTVTAGVLNLLDKDPPRTVQNSTFQRGYDPRFTNPLGRTFTLYGSYKFF
ncbi:TonB-dependent receptor [Piscinibacter sakaiensis]|uniref:TonB-dependent receptor n=1 Tax=Piscinibacter sakaiensis TaxID=1547922 RepID=UPI003AAEF751